MTPRSSGALTVTSEREGGREVWTGLRLGPRRSRRVLPPSLERTCGGGGSGDEPKGASNCPGVPRRSRSVLRSRRDTRLTGGPLSSRSRLVYGPSSLPDTDSTPSLPSGPVLLSPKARTRLRLGSRTFTRVGTEGTRTHRRTSAPVSLGGGMGRHTSGAGVGVPSFPSRKGSL